MESYTLRGSKFKSAQEFWQNPPIMTGERLQGFRNTSIRKKNHLGYMDFAELYADYVVTYEKANSKLRKS